LAAITAPERTAAQHQSLLHFVGEGNWSDEKVLAKVREMVLPAIERVYNEVLQFLKRIISETEMNILLIPHVFHEREDNNDLKFMKQLMQDITHKNRMAIVSKQYNAMELKYILSQCRYFIGARTHATIGALSSLVPTISLGYSIKSKGINEDIFGHTDYVVPINEFSCSLMWEKMTVFFEKEKEIKAHLAASMVNIKQMARSNITFLKELLSR
jgi:polysaccharide pyruvyl transferase WcaK-like protein